MSKILVADDNSNIQKMVALALKDQGVKIIAVGNGEAAVRKMPEVHPDLVLADIFMPVRSGYEVCEFVKHDPRYAHIPVVLLVGAFDPLDEQEAQRVGADGVLKKPFVPPEPLIAMVRNMLAKSAGEHLEPVGVAAAPAAAPAAASPEIASQDVALAAPGGLPPEEFKVQPRPVAFEQGEKPLAFEELMEAAPAETPAAPESEMEVTTRPDTEFAETRFWHQSEPAEETPEESEAPAWKPPEPVWPEQEKAAPLSHTYPEPVAHEPLPAEPAQNSVVSMQGAASHLPEVEPPPNEPAWGAPEHLEPEYRPSNLAASDSSGLSVEEELPPFESPVPADSVAPPAAIEQQQRGVTTPAGLSPGVWEELAQNATKLADTPWPTRTAPVEEVVAAGVSEPAPSVAADYAAHEEAFEAAPPVEAVPASVPPAVARTAQPVHSGTVQTFATPPSAAAGAVDPELVEAVVAKVLERMQPQILDVVTREILKPVVEALVRREMERH